jgi:hypothetical protein
LKNVYILLVIFFIGCTGGSTTDNDKQKDDSESVSKQKDQPANSKTTSSLVISEILAGNKDTVLDPDFYNFSDYIEIHNRGESSLDISGYYLSDDEKEPLKWRIPENTTIEPDGYMVFWADKKDTKLHTNFKLSLKKESVVLSNKDGKKLDSINYKNLMTDISATKKDNSIFFMVPSPNKKNSELYKDAQLSSKPVFSKSSGFFDTTELITLSNSEQAPMYYTVDGSVPTKRSKLYKDPIEISSSQTIRARSFSKGKFAGVVVTNSYILNSDNIDPKIPILSLSIDDRYLFDDMIGMHTVGKNGVKLTQCVMKNDELRNYARDWKRGGYIEYFDTKREKKFGFEADFSIAGQCSRSVDQKSFKVDLDKKYGLKSFEYKLFADKDIEKFKDFKLRVGYEGYYILDMLGAAIVKSGELDVDYQAYQTLQLYTNGEYWGLYNLRETKGENYIKANHNDVDKKLLDIIDKGKIAKSGTMDEYNKLTTYVNTHDLSLKKNYDEVADMVDIDSLIDYMIVMIYSANPDWIGRNTRCFKERKKGSKWRWMLDDLDMGFGMSKIDMSFFTVAQGGYKDRSSTLSELFKKLLLNSEFKTRFKNRFNKLLDTLFKPANISGLIHQLVDTRLKYMDLKPRWYANKARVENFVDNELKDFIENRVNELKTELNSL